MNRKARQIGGLEELADMARIAIEDMTDGQLVLEFASTCTYHQADGVRALGYASRVPSDFLRSALIDYRDAKGNKKKEEALLRVVNWKPAA